MQDRDYYRALDSHRLLTLAREEGINPEMAIALADRVANLDYGVSHMTGSFHFNHSKETTK